MKIEKAGRLIGTVRLPGDKSISHRAAMLASIAEGRTRIENFATSADCASTLACFERMGVRIERRGDSVTIDGAGLRELREAAGPLDCGNSGTTMRLIAGILAGQAFNSVLIGDASLSARPMRRVIEPLTKMGASIGSRDGHAPLTIDGAGELTAIEYEPPFASAQIKSCVLLGGLYADGTTAVTERTPTRDHTERMLRGFGVDVREENSGHGRRISIEGGQRLSGRDLAVPGDISSAAFLMAAAACLPGSRLEMPGVGVNPTRNAVIGVMRGLGARVESVNERLVCGEPVADITVSGGLGQRSAAGPIRGELIANLIDEIPILAVFGTQVEGGLEIRDAAELRVKESDRIAAVVANLRRMGAEVEEFEDGLRVRRSRLRGAAIETFHDHRIAMAFAVAGLFADGETVIEGADCADVSYPGFFDVLGSLARG